MGHAYLVSEHDEFVFALSERWKEKRSNMKEVICTLLYSGKVITEIGTLRSRGNREEKKPFRSRRQKGWIESLAIQKEISSAV